MGPNGIKINILWPKQNQWQFSKYCKAYFDYVFKRRKTYSWNLIWTAGFNIEKDRVSLERFTPKGYLLISAVGVRSDDGGRSRALGGGRRRSPAVGRHGRRHELAGVHRKMRYGPLFAKPIAWGDRGGQGDLT